LCSCLKRKGGVGRISTMPVKYFYFTTSTIALDVRGTNSLP
jgi:hypothetical protein